MTLPSPSAPALSQERRLLRSRVGRALAPHWGALLALALFMGVGLAVLDDYGIAVDEALHRNVALAKLRYIQGEPLALPSDSEFHSFYGTAFQLPLALAERAFDLQDVRGVHLSRHLITHLFYLTGGLFAYLLARRLFRSTFLAVAALLTLLLTPRLYAHSFYNGQDVPFLVMFAVALYLAHRAFKRDTLLAFALLGVGVGMLANLRIMGVILLAAIPALRALDLAWGRGWGERKRALLATGVFALASLLTAYALQPHLWPDPLPRAAEGWTTLSAPLPHAVFELFRGTIYRSSDFPIEYIPVWFSITSPPFALLLGLIGVALILFRAVNAPREALRNTRLRFGLLLAGCFALPILAVMYSDVAHYNDWRHMYFLWAPFALLAVWGLRGLAATLRSRRLRAAVCGVAGVAVAATVVSMALIHPNQQASFNFSVDRVTPERLSSQYTMEYGRHPTLQALLWVSDNADLLPDKTAEAARNIYERTLAQAMFLPDAARARIAGNTSFDLLLTVIRQPWARSARALHRVQVYGNTILTIERKDDLQAVYDATRESKPDAVAAFDVHQLDGAVALVMEPCAAAFIERVDATLRATPVNPGDLPPWREGKRDEPRYFHLHEFGRLFDGKCVASLPLPDYLIADFRLAWSPELLTRESAREAMRRARENGRLLTRSAYDLYLAGNELVYIQEPCDPIGTRHPFLASVFPERADDLPEEWRERGHQRFWFDFHAHGALLEEGACVALFPLPDYPIAAIRTGQFTEDGGDLWEAAFSANPEPYATAYRAVAGSEPLARGAFDLHLLNGDLVYIKEPCEQMDTEARFFLHVVPERVSDLPEARRELGWDNLDFRFFLNGAWFDGQCAARVSLPDYPIASVRTGQFVSGEGEVWSADFAVGDRLRFAGAG